MPRPTDRIFGVLIGLLILIGSGMVAAGLAYSPEDVWIAGPYTPPTVVRAVGTMVPVTATPFQKVEKEQKMMKPAHMPIAVKLVHPESYQVRYPSPMYNNFNCGIGGPRDYCYDNPAPRPGPV